MVLPAFLNALIFRSGRMFLLFTAVWVLIYLALVLVYLPLRYRNLSFTVTDEQIILHSGVIYNRVRSIPLRNIQFTAVYRNPFDGLFGLCSLVVTAAGGRITLPGLRIQDAEALSEVLL